MQPEGEANPQTPSLRLDGRMAMVTGAGWGIGRGCAIALAKAGADLTLMARSRSELEETACEVRATGQNVQSIVCDVTDSRQVEEAVDFLEQRASQPTWVLCSSGFSSLAILSGPAPKA